MLNPTRRPRRLIEDDIRALEQLFDSPGWRLIREAITTDIDAATQRLALDPAMPTDICHYRRGLLAAAINYRGLPATLLQHLNTELTLSTPATAGKETP